MYPIATLLAILVYSPLLVLFHILPNSLANKI